MQHFIRKHPVQSILLTLLVAYGLWWLGNDIALRTYPQRVAKSIPLPPGVELVATDTGYSRKCKSAGMIQYFTTNEPWDKIVAYYTGYLQKNWHPKGDGLSFYRKFGEYNQLQLILHHIDLTSEGKPKDPLLKQIVFTGSTVYLVQVSYNQDLRVFNPGGVCEPKD